MPVPGSQRRAVGAAGDPATGRADRAALLAGAGLAAGGGGTYPVERAAGGGDMSRGVAYRWELTGDLVAESPVHIGGVGDGPPDLLQVRDGLNRPVLPGTSLAGALQAALNLEGEEERLWRPTSPAPHVKVGDAHDASWVLVDDAPADQSTTEIRDHVSIDRIHGTAAR